jgi:hypothetical protein
MDRARNQHSLKGQNVAAGRTPLEPKGANETRCATETSESDGGKVLSHNGE